MNEMISTNLYPVDRLNSDEAIHWLKDIKTLLDKDGSCLFPNFITSDALSTMAQQAKSIAHMAYPGPAEVSPYFFNYKLGEGQDLPEKHPLRRKGKRNLAQVATDLIPEDFLLSQLYRSEAMQRFLSAIIEQPVYRNELKAGTLSLFRGHYSLHRVTEVEGNQQRLQAILGYTTKPGHIGNKDSSIMHYGQRVAEIESINPRYLV